jgi:hypothetical protein
METGLKEAAGTARVQGRGAGKDRKQEAGTARRQGSGFRVQGSGFRVQGSGTARKVAVIPAKAGIHVSRINQTEPGSPLSRG